MKLELVIAEEALAFTYDLCIVKKIVPPSTALCYSSLNRVLYAKQAN